MIENWEWPQIIMIAWLVLVFMVGTWRHEHWTWFMTTGFAVSLIIWGGFWS